MGHLWFTASQLLEPVDTGLRGWPGGAGQSHHTGWSERIPLRVPALLRFWD